jgi:hypothetical protein
VDFRQSVAGLKPPAMNADIGGVSPVKARFAAWGQALFHSAAYTERQQVFENLKDILNGNRFLEISKIAIAG